MHFSRPDFIWARTTVFIKPVLLKFFRTLMRIFLGIFGEKFGGVVKIPTYVSAKILWNYGISEGNFYFSLWFRPSDKKRIFAKKSAWLKIFILHTQKRFPGRKRFSVIRSFFHKCFPTLRDIVSEIWQTFVQQTVIIALHLSRWFWWRETRY